MSAHSLGKKFANRAAISGVPVVQSTGQKRSADGEANGDRAAKKVDAKE